MNRYLAILAGSSFFACTAAQPPPAAPAAPVTENKQKTVETTLASAGLDGAALDRGVDPCTDFYQFACGGWLQKTEIPSDKSRWMRSFNEIHKSNEEELRRILDESTKGTAKDPASKKIGAFHKACMDEAGIEKAGVAPLEPLLELVKKVRDPKTLSAAVTELHKHSIWPIFDVDDAQDFKDATKVIAMLDQNGLGLPDRDYYETGDQDLDKKKPAELSDDDKAQIEKSKKIRDQYVAHVERMMKLAGLPEWQAKIAASDVMKVETALAKISRTRVERRDPHKLYNKIDREGVEKAAPHFAWSRYFEGLGIGSIRDINVTNVAYFEGIDGLMGSFKPLQWQYYLSWHVVRAMAPSLSKAFVDEAFAMKKVLTGQPEQRPRWKRCVEAADDALGELVAQPYISTKFAGESKAAAEKMVKEIGNAFSVEVRKLDWMDKETQDRAIAKLTAMEYLIGYPEKWKSYDWEVDPAYATNVLRSRAFELQRALKKIGKPVDRKEWFMSPPTVNAYYHPLMNHMVFPAGILQPPFYSVKAAIPVNLGAMGMVVGHEITHGFDDQGSKFDKDGNLKDWWGDAVRPKFDAKTKCVDDLYSSFEPLPGLKVNGKLTLGENIADLGGIKLAFAAYRAMQKDAPEVAVAEGFTEDQQFFLGTAQAWCGKYRDEALTMRVKTDPHSPPQYRVNGPLSNLTEFAEAFSCAEGTPMSPKNKCDVW